MSFFFIPYKSLHFHDFATMVIKTISMYLFGIFLICALLFCIYYLFKQLIPYLKKFSLFHKLLPYIIRIPQILTLQFWIFVATSILRPLAFKIIMKALNWIFPGAKEFVYKKAKEFAIKKVKQWIYNNKLTVFKYIACFLMIIIINIASLFSRNIRYFVRICILAYCILHYSDIINGFTNINEKLLKILTLFKNNKLVMKIISFYSTIQIPLFENIQSFKDFNSILPIWYHWNSCMIAIFPLFILFRYSTINIFFIIFTCLLFIILRSILFIGGSIGRIYIAFIHFKELLFEFIDFLGEQMLRIGERLCINFGILEIVSFVESVLTIFRNKHDEKSNEKESKNKNDKESKTESEKESKNKNDKESKSESEKESKTESEIDCQTENEDEFRIIRHIWHQKSIFTLLLLFLIFIRNFLITYLLCVVISLVLLGLYAMYNVFVSKLTHTEFNYKFMWRMYFINRLVIIKPIWMQFFSYDAMYGGRFFNFEEYTFLQLLFLISYYIRFISYMFIFFKSTYETTFQKVHSQRILLMLFIPF